MKKNLKPIRVKRSESEIKSLLKEQANGNIKVNEFCKTHQISRALFYNWCNKYGSLQKQPGFVPVQIPEHDPVQAIFAEIEFSQKLTIRLFRYVDPSYIKAFLKS